MAMRIKFFYFFDFLINSLFGLMYFIREVLAVYQNFIVKLIFKLVHPSIGRGILIFTGQHGSEAYDHGFGYY